MAEELDLIIYGGAIYKVLALGSYKTYYKNKLKQVNTELKPWIIKILANKEEKIAAFTNIYLRGNLE